MSILDGNSVDEGAIAALGLVSEQGRLRLLHAVAKQWELSIIWYCD